MHRELSLTTQIKHMIALNMVDDIIISNCYPSQKEMDDLKDLDYHLVTFDVMLSTEIPEIEQKILFDELHFNRGDVNENMIRSTQSRVKYKGHYFAEKLRSKYVVHRNRWWWNKNKICVI